MRTKSCLCLHCARISDISLDNEIELESIACPQCGLKRLVLLPEKVFSGGT